MGIDGLSLCRNLHTTQFERGTPQDGPKTNRLQNETLRYTAIHCHAMEDDHLQKQLSAFIDALVEERAAHIVTRTALHSEMAAHTVTRATLHAERAAHMVMKIQYMTLKASYLKLREASEREASAIEVGKLFPMEESTPEVLLDADEKTKIRA